MKRYLWIFLTLTILALCVININAQEQENEYSVENILDILNEDFENYPWAHIYYSRKIQDDGEARTKFVRRAYDEGEIVTIEIRMDGWRYEVKINFAKEKQAYAKRSYDIKMAVYQVITGLFPQTEQDGGS
jgi:hypothetical protein